MHAHIEGKRIRIEAKDGKYLYYDIDADNRVYWLRVRKNNKLQRYRVSDSKLAEEIRMIADKAKVSSGTT